MTRLITILFLYCCSGQLLAQQVVTFGGDQQFSLEFVEIGNPGNPDDPLVLTADLADAPSTTNESFPSGGVDYMYGISKFEISLEQFQIADANAGIGYSAAEALRFFGNVENVPRPNMPVSASWNQAARFVNWLNISSGYEPAYRYAFQPGEDGYSRFASNELWDESSQGHNPENRFRNGMARFVLPSLDEWHKAAYYDPERDDGSYWLYSSGSDEPATPVASGTEPGTAVYLQPRAAGPASVEEAGGPSAYGVFAMGENMMEIIEGTYDRANDAGYKGRDARGYPWFTDQFRANGTPEAYGVNSHFFYGIRVVDLGEIPAGDFNGDRVFTPRDIDELVDAINSPKPRDFYDLNGDGSVNSDDRTFWIEELANVTYGDADMNGEVDFEDFLALSGAYETDGGWSGGDFDGSGLTDFVDFLTLSGNFGQTVTAVASVPEPSSVALASFAMFVFGLLRRRRGANLPLAKCS